MILFASQGRYLSRNLQQVMKNIIGRAIEAVAASHIDPYRYTIMLCIVRIHKKITSFYAGRQPTSILLLYPGLKPVHCQSSLVNNLKNIVMCSVLPEDDWFAEVAQIAIDMLTGKTQVGTMENVSSPTASSVLSHGSN